MGHPLDFMQIYADVCYHNILPVGLFGVLLAAGSSTLAEGTEDGGLSPCNSSFLVTSSLRMQLCQKERSCEIRHLTRHSVSTFNNDPVYNSRTPYVTLKTNISTVVGQPGWFLLFLGDGHLG